MKVEDSETKQQHHVDDNALSNHNPSSMTLMPHANAETKVIEETLMSRVKEALRRIID